MNFVPKIFAILFLSLFCLTLSANKIDIYQDSIARTILQEQPELIQTYQDGKVYLKSENIFSESNGLILKSDKFSWKLPAVFSDEKGCYLQVNNSWMWVVCGVCGYEFEITPIVTSCPNCGHGS